MNVSIQVKESMGGGGVIYHTFLLLPQGLDCRGCNPGRTRTPIKAQQYFYLLNFPVLFNISRIGVMQ